MRVSAQADTRGLRVISICQVFSFRSPSDRMFETGGKERQGPTLGVRCPVSVLQRCPFYRGVRLIDMRVDYKGHVVGINMRD